MLKAKLKKGYENVREHARTVAVAAGTASALAVPTVVSFAADSGTNFLDSDTMTLITSAMSNLVVTVTAVVAIAIPAGMTIIGLTTAADYAMKKIKGVLRKAS
ncbi:hypothetical protein AALB39_28825 [Lachnospiraceae bacterium 54-53]